MTGVSQARKKNGSIYYRSGITYRGRHISLGSFSTEDTAAAAYLDASKLLTDAAVTLVDFRQNILRSPLKKSLSFLISAITGFILKRLFI